jgi:hypothetical protein
MRFIVSRDYSPYGRVSLNSRLRLGIGAAVLIVATAAVTASVMSRWNPFPPQDYEDCAARSAKDAKSKEALSILLSICGTEFKGRRKAGGGYTYYDRCQDRAVEIKGPNPTTDEQKDMREECLAYLDAQARVAAEDTESERKAQQAAQEASAEATRKLQARQSAATTAVGVDLIGFKCSLMTIDCDHADLKFRATNRSKEHLSGLTIGLASAPKKNDVCPVSFSFQVKTWIALSPGETGVFEIISLDPELAKHPLCMKVLDVKIAGD